MKLHLGCGEKHIDGFVNIDIRQLKGVDITDDISTLSEFEVNSVDLIYASHVLEHFGRNIYLSILTRWHELLKKDGVLRLAVPDFEAMHKHYSKFKNLRIITGLLWGGQTYAQNYHTIGWDFNTLKADLKTVGFRKVKKYDWRLTEHAHIDDYSQCYLPHMDKKNGLLMSLNVEAIK